MVEWFKDVVSESAWTYLVEAAFVAVDGFFPVVPGETVVITAAVIASGDGLVIWFVALAAFVGAVVGDNVSYLIGVKIGRPAARRFFRGDRSRTMLGWGRVQLRERGTIVIIAARFVPGGRTATTFSAGMLEMSWRRFIAADVAGAALWSAYTASLGWFGGSAFSESFWKPLAASFAVAGFVALLGELVRRLRTGDDGDRSYHREADGVLGE